MSLIAFSPRHKALERVPLGTRRLSAPGAAAVKAEAAYQRAFGQWTASGRLISRLHREGLPIAAE
jgi:hypothetical protein